jgi:hypothetical protein
MGNMKNKLSWLYNIGNREGCIRETIHSHRAKHNVVKDETNAIYRIKIEPI